MRVDAESSQPINICTKDWTEGGLLPDRYSSELKISEDKWSPSIAVADVLHFIYLFIHSYMASSVMVLASSINQMQYSMI